ncbi:MAG: tRNA uridine-5-carboxymethylaminomethyl(34) synthesis GTPase MnmE [Clostridia bacterium]|nr:tRNA uridine-5-carboxymethylaminomethyl(34) synthesis GTPase MnmE [Clostridia bacterium]
MKTIVGIATPMGFGGVGILRLSGADALSITAKMFNRPLKPRYATLGVLTGDNFTDTVLVIYFPAPHSFTGEDVVEIQAHGGWHLMNRIMQTAIKHGATPAEPGEFTRIAVLNNKMTLNQAESSLELINAESDAELQNAARLMAGELEKQVNSIEKDLIDARALIDAYLDYPEDLDSPELPMTQINRAKANIEQLLTTANHGQMIKNGINVCLIGCPNAGKSSLFNSLIGDNRSIVTDIAGTTTDTISEKITYQGIKINLIDTAGIRENATSVIEEHGIARAKSIIQEADILLVIVDATTREMVDYPKDKKHLIVYNKSDLCADAPNDGIAVSAKTGKNIELILRTIVEMATKTAPTGSMIYITNERQTNLLRQAQNLLAEINPHAPLDQISANITLALSYIGKITGTDIDERTLDEIFSKFCLGK